MTPAAERPPLFRDGRYVRIWLVGWFTGIVRWLDLLAYGIYALDLTGSPFLVALIALLRFLPLAVFSLFFGAAADTLSPRKVLFWALVGLSLVTVGLVVIEGKVGLSYAHLVVGTLASGIFWASDMPLRRKMIGEIAGDDRLARAMSYDYATSNGTRLFGPLIGGVVYQTIGMDGVLVIGLALYILSAVLAAGIRPTGGKRGGAFRPIHTIVGSLRSARRAFASNDAASILLVTVIFNIWSFPFVSMIPVLGQGMSLDPATIGYVAAIEGAASLVSVMIVSWLAHPAIFRRLYFWGVAIHLLAVAFIGFVPGFWPLCIGLAISGLAISSFAAMQATLIYMIAPRGMRGRYLGLMSICIGAGLIGFANVGLMAELFGAQSAVAIIACEGLIAIAVLGWRWKAFRAEPRLALKV